MKQLITLVLLCFLASCKKDKIDPRQAILGKWELFYLGNGEPQPPRKPSGYREFLPDSLLLEYDYASKKTGHYKYWTDTLLHIGIPRGDGLLLRLDHEFRFEGDTLRLDWVNATPILSVFKYKRIH